MDPEDVDPALPGLVAAVREAIGEGLLALVLHGSAVGGGLHPRSDLDLLAVVERSLDEAQRRAVVAALLPRSGRWPVVGTMRPVELTVVVRADVVPWRHPAMRDLQYGEWVRAGSEAGEVPQRALDPDLAVLLSLAVDRGRSLVGPPPAELLDPVPIADVRAAGEASILGLVADLEEDTANVLLTLARIAATDALGTILSKDAAAEWAVARLPSSVAASLVAAHDVYLGTRQDTWVVGSEVRATADALVALLDR